MELGDLREVLRNSVLDDATAPYLWPDADLNRYLNNAVREACIRGRLLKGDADTLPNICAVAIIAGQADYKLDPAITVVRSAILLGGCEKLGLTTSAAMDQRCAGWDDGTERLGTPRWMIMDVSQTEVRLHPTPCAASTLRLRVWRSPLDVEIMEGDDDEPCVNLLAPEELKHWAAFEAFMSKDSEQNDPDRAATHLQLFEATFGPRPNQHEIARWADTPPTRPIPQYF